MISNDARIEDDASIPHDQLVNIYGCTIGAGTRVGPFVEIQRDVIIGRNCKISSHSFLCTGVIVEDGVFIGHGVMFTNDLYPQALNARGELQTEADWNVIPTKVEANASIGSNATILAGVTIGAGSLVGAGAVVTRDVPPGVIVAGVPARVVGTTSATNHRVENDLVGTIQSAES